MNPSGVSYMDDCDIYNVIIKYLLKNSSSFESVATLHYQILDFLGLESVGLQKIVRNLGLCGKWKMRIKSP